MPEHQVQLLEFLADVDMVDEDRFGWSRGRENRLNFWVNCSDRFAWAAADVEVIESGADVGALCQARLDAIAAEPDAQFDSDWALLWCARKREMRLQGAAYSFLPKALWPLFDAVGPERAIGLSNPYRPGQYDPPGRPT
jgi:hypothetical protein